MREAQIEKEVNASIAQGGSATAQYITLLMQEGKAIGMTNEELLIYIAEMGNADGLTLTGNETWLKELRSELQLTEAELQRFISLFNAAGGTKTGNVGHGAPSNIPSMALQKATQRRAKSELDTQLKIDKLNEKFSSGSKGGGGPNSPNSLMKYKRLTLLSLVLLKNTTKMESLL